MVGLDCSHDAWSGSYTAFRRFRREIAKALGGSWPPHDPGTVDPDSGEPVPPDQWCWSTRVLPEEHRAGMLALMDHSDCGGEITPDDCILVAAFLRWVAPRLPDTGQGHLSRGYRTAAERFAAGCEAAAAAGEPLTFG